MGDTLKTTALGGASAAVIGLGVLPDIISVCVGIVTIIYFVLKIKNEIKE